MKYYTIDFKDVLEVLINKSIVSLPRNDKCNAKKEIERFKMNYITIYTYIFNYVTILELTEKAYDLPSDKENASQRSRILANRVNILKMFDPIFGFRFMFETV